MGALATDKSGAGGSWSYLAKNYSVLAAPYGSSGQQKNKKQLHNLSGTSGLTQPLIKAILQYSAQPIVGANLLQQGTGLLNVDGAVRMARALRIDIASAIEAGTLHPGDNLLAPGETWPAAASTINGEAFGWSRVVVVGGRHLVSGSARLTSYQPIYDPRLVWVGKSLRRSTLSWWPAATGVSANTFVRSITEAAVANNQVLLTPGVLSVTALAGASSLVGKTGAFIPTATLSGWLASGSGLVMSEGLIMSEGVVLSEGGQTGVALSNDAPLLGEP